MTKMNKEQAVEFLSAVIKGKKRHVDYDRVVEMAKKMKSLITGEDMDSLMRKFDRRESEEQFEQRKQITQHITSTVSRNLMKPEYKIPRSNGVRRILGYSNDTENEKLHKLNKILDKFWGDRSFDEYLGSRWIDLTNIDPNSFIVFEWDSFNEKKEKAQPYPFEVSAEEAIYFKFDNNILNLLVVMNRFEPGVGSFEDIARDDVHGKHYREKYTLYAPGFSIVFDELTEDEQRGKQLPSEGNVKTVDGVFVICVGNKYYYLKTYDTKLNFIPAFRSGFEYDPVTMGRTCIPPIWDAVPILMKTIKANSELDLTMSLHAHPQKLQYVRACQAENCNGGRLPGGKTCTTCKGTGREKVSTSAQEAIELNMPRDKDDMITLDNIVRYVSPPVDLVQFQDEYIKSLTAQCKEAIYNSEIFSRQEIAETATGKNIDLQNVYDALYPMAKAFAKKWESGIRFIASITDMMKDIGYAYIFNKDFKMKSMSELIMDLKTAADSKADDFVKKAIQDDIAQIVYTDNPVGLSKHRTMDRFYPYSGKTPEQIGMILAETPADDFHRNLWEMYGWIFEEIERDQQKKGINFYDLNPQKQYTIIRKKVEKRIGERKDEQPNMREEVIVEE